MFAARGFTCLEVDLAPPEGAVTSEAMMKHFEEGECLASGLYTEGWIANIRSRCRYHSASMLSTRSFQLY